VSDVGYSVSQTTSRLVSSKLSVHSQTAVVTSPKMFKTQELSLWSPVAKGYVQNYQ